MTKDNDSQNGASRRSAPSTGLADKAMVAIVAGLEANQAPILDDLKSVWGKDANRVIRQLVRDGVAGVHRRRLRKVDGKRYKFGEGVVEQKGPGRFLLNLGEGEEAYLTAKSSKLVVAGDNIRAFLASEDDSDTEALPSSLESRDFGREHVARGRAMPDGTVAFFLDNRVEDVRLEMRVPDAVAGDLWFCKIQDQGLFRDAVAALPASRIGNEADKGIESKLAFATRFPLSAICDESEWPKRLGLADSADNAERVDVRSVPLVTIDGPDTNDFDDAIGATSLNRRQGGWEILVGIADVSSYVPRGSALDQFACQKMTSVYLPHMVHPMLPRSLSNGVCSLNPNEDRLALCCRLVVSATGETETFEFFRGLMKSHARLTYESAQSYLDTGASLPSPAVEGSLACLSAAAKAMRSAGMKNGRLDMGDDEISFAFDASGKISGLRSSPRLWTHKIVEECMLAANRAAGQYISESYSLGIYRNHLGVKVEGLALVHETLATMGVKVGDGVAPITQRQIAEALDEAKALGKYAQARSAILGGMSSANYEAENHGHFSLAAPYYCHFTSPIRRYPDLMVHHLIKAILDKKPSPYSEAESHDFSQKASRFSQLASQAENEARKLLILHYAKNFEGQTMDARISTIGERTMWVAMPFPGASLEFVVVAKALKMAGLQWSDVDQAWSRDGKAVVEGDALRCKIVSSEPCSRRVELMPEPSLAPEGRPGGARP